MFEKKYWKLKVSYSFVFPNFRELHILVLHIFPVNFLILKSEYFLYLN